MSENNSGIWRAGRSMFRLVWGAINVLCVVALIVASYSGYIAPEVCVWAQLPGMTLPLWIAVILALLVVNLFVMRRMALVEVLAFAVCSGPVLTVCPVNFGSRKLSAADRERSFTLLTYNVINFTDQQGADPEWGNRTLSYILSTDADIVCLQEAVPIMGNYRNAKWQAQLDSLHARYPYYDQTRYNYDMVMSKYPLKTLPIPPHPEWETGNYSAYQVDIEGHSVTLVNCHLQSIGLTSGDKELYLELTDSKNIRPTRKEISEVKNGMISKLLEAFRQRAGQARDIRDFLDTRQGNVIVVGDFNDVPGSYAYHTVCSAGLRDAYADCAFGSRATYNANRFYFHIDQVLYRGDFRAMGIVRSKVRYSDHYPLLTTFVWDHASADIDATTGSFKDESK